MNRNNLRLACVFMLLMLLLAACGRADTVATETSGAGALVVAGNAQLEQGAYANALQTFNDALAQQPELAAALAGRAQVNSALGNLDAAIADATRALNADDVEPALGDELRALVFYVRAVTLAQQGKLEQALADVEASLALDAANADVHIVQGTTLSALGRVEEATASFQAALRLRPNDATVLAMQSIAYAQAGNLDAAEADLARAVKFGLSPEQEAQVRALFP